LVNVKVAGKVRAETKGRKKKFRLVLDSWIWDLEKNA
jgi:hypothetical protein